MDKWNSLVIPPWVKWVSLAVLAVSLWGHGYVSGIERANDKAVAQDVKIIYKQGKTTTKVITKYVKQKQKQDKVNKEIQNDGEAFAIKYPATDSPFNNEYVWLFNNSATGIISTLPSGELSGNSGVTVSESLSVGIVNNQIAREWKERALTCEAWTQEQEKESVE